MSDILRDSYLDPQLRQPLLEAITGAVTSTVEIFGTDTFLSGSVIDYNDDGLGMQSYDIAKPQESQALYIRKLSYELSEAITNEVIRAVAASVQQYLRANVTTSPALVTAPQNGPLPHVHVVPPLTLFAP